MSSFITCVLLDCREAEIEECKINQDNSSVSVINDGYQAPELHTVNVTFVFTLRR